jgi:hypothetical protein
MISLANEHDFILAQGQIVLNNLKEVMLGE